MRIVYDLNFIENNLQINSNKIVLNHSLTELFFFFLQERSLDVGFP